MAAGVFIVLLVVTGRMHWLGAALAAVVPILKPLLHLALRNIPLLAQLYQRYATNRAQHQSTVRAQFIEMQLDHESGDLTGRVLQGQHAGSALDDLSPEQLRELLKVYRRQDRDSARLLESYLQRRFAEEFDQSDAQDETESEERRQDSSGKMNRQEALAILGLQESASKADILAAHRSLMQKLHPDRGGNDYLAGKLNQARDLLLASQ